MDIFEVIMLIFVGLVVIRLIYGIANSKSLDKLPDEPTYSFSEMKAKSESRKKSPTSRPSAPATFFPCVKEMEVKGTYYRSLNGKAAARDVEVGDNLILESEPDNPVDPNAVKVLTLDNVHIGYVQWDIAQFVKNNIKHVKSCIVTKVSGNDIPKIIAKIDFSASECKQQEMIPEELRVSPEQKMRDLTDGIKKEYKYQYDFAHVEGCYENPDEVIDKIRTLRKGDRLVLKISDQTSDHAPYRMDVYTPDDTMIGFIYGFFAKDIYESFNDIYAVMVESPLDKDRYSQLVIKVFVPTKPRESEPGIYASFHSEYRGPYPELCEAMDLKNIDHAAALDIALPIASREKGIAAKFLCCQIYRLQKDYESEKDMILRILNRIDNADPRYTSPDDMHHMKSQLPTIQKRLNTVETRLNSKSRKK